MEVLARPERKAFLLTRAPQDIAASNLVIIHLQAAATAASASGANLEAALEIGSLGKPVLIESLVSKQDLERSYPEIWERLAALPNVASIDGQPSLDDIWSAARRLLQP